MAVMPLHDFTFEDYLSFEEYTEPKHEFYLGSILARPGGSAAHGLISTNLIAAMGNALRDSEFYVFGCDLRIAARANHVVFYPDVSVFRGQPIACGLHTYFNPTGIIEVTSPETRRYDRGLKAEAYRQMSSLKEFLLVEQQPADIEHWSLLDNGHWDIARIQDRNAILRLRSLNVDLPVAEIYRGVEEITG